jgi:ATP-dependent protease ClpP protease subunit
MGSEHRDRFRTSISTADVRRWNELAQSDDGRRRLRYRIHNSTDTAVIDLYDEIGGWGVSASDFIGELRQITASTIELHVNSGGGDVYDGLAMYNGLLDHPARVTAIVDAIAASAASFIIQAADQVTMGRNAELMIHDALGLTVGNAAAHREMADLLDKASDNIASIYATRAGNGGVKTWRGRMTNETWYSAQESVDIGLADSVQSTSRRSGVVSDLRRPAASVPPEPVATPDDAPEPEAEAPEVPITDAITDADTQVCPNCGADVPADATECPDCGAAMSATSDSLGGHFAELTAMLDKSHEDPRGLHRALLDAALETDFADQRLLAARREDLEDFAYDADALKGFLVDLIEHPDPPDVPPSPEPEIRSVDLDTFTTSVRRALSS